MDFSCAGRALIALRLGLPEFGAWKASSVEVDGDDPISGQVDLELAGGVVLKGTVVSGGASDTRVLANIRPGRGLLTVTEIPGQHFFEATPRTIAENIVAHTANDPTLRETINAAMPAICDEPIARWMRLKTTADDALSQLVRYLGLAWWFDPDGQIRIGELEYPEVRPSSIDIFPHDNPEWTRLDFATDDETIMPRTTVVTEYGSYRVKEVRYYLHENRWRGTLDYASP
jgi:hypothetical protein